MSGERVQNAAAVSFCFSRKGAASRRFAIGRWFVWIATKSVFCIRFILSPQIDMCEYRHRYPEFCMDCDRPLKSDTCHSCGSYYGGREPKKVKKKNLVLPSVREALPNQLAKNVRKK